MGLEMEKEAVFPPSVPYHSQQFYHSCLLQFKIITSAIQTDNGDRPNTRGEEGVMNSDHRTWKTSPIHQPTKMTWHKTQQTLELGM
jgi:hypothetical protein